SYFSESLSLHQQATDKRGIPTDLNNIGKVYSNLGEHQKALDYYNQCLPLYIQMGSKAGEARTLYNIASLQRDSGDFKASLTQMERVIKIVEDLRTKIDSQELRTSYFATVQDYYEFYIDLLMQLHKQHPSQGYDALALQTSERARARSLLELLTEANADIRQGVEPKLLSQEHNLQEQLDTLEKRRIQLLNVNHTEAKLQALGKEIEAVLEQYQKVQAQIRATSPRYAALTQPQPLSLTQIQQQVLDDNTLLLEYSLGEKRSYLWAVTNKSITSYELPKRADIEATVQKFRQEITTPYLRNSPSIDTLSQIILAPVAQELGKKRLAIASDGALQYVPFSALATPGSSSYEPLLLNHEIITLPSASTVAILRREHKERKSSASKTLVVLADPIFSSDDERLEGKVKVSPSSVPESNLDSQALTRSAQDSDVNFQRLRFTRQEAEQILSLVPVSDRKQAFDFNASRTTASSENLSQYRIIHFATHGILNSKHPELSGVVLSLFDDQGRPQNGFLRLHDIFNLNLQAELVVLSACKTGLGEEVKGEGLVGLTRGFMYAGSPRVVVSLWSVDDQATSELMKVFYKKMLQEKLKPAAALRTAQIEIWRTQKYSAPYYWAAFTLQGEWK
ncbi:CHAT domain-containing protein, partial [uncultured Nostoc sp.]|uniref:CHAT domain-containing protein n=1 Tax=uncultured Nostoc sp. TaxID=340711 RepID=UPI0035CC58F0